MAASVPSLQQPGDSPCSIALALFGGHHIDIARYIGHLLAPAFGAFRFFSFMLRDGLGTFKFLSALLTTILVGRHGLASINQGDRECHFTAGGNPISAMMSANVPKTDIGKPATTGRSEKSFLLMCVEMRNTPKA